MTNKLQQITTLALATILIAGSFSLTPFAYSTGWDDDDDDDDSNHIKKGLCKDPNNKIVDGCFEAPTVTNSKGWGIFEMNNDGTHNTDLGWKVAWQESSPCSDLLPGSSSVGLLELQKGILGGPAEGYQHAELDSDCNGPDGSAGGPELTSVAISQTIATSESYDYKITFAYKARPNQPIPTNGLLVTWNGEILANNLPFSMKDWKYFSKTVSAPTGSIQVSFIDTGEPNSFGTFLDDVSVIPIKKPMSSITLIKAFTNDNSGTASPTDFVMKIKKVGGTSEIPIPHTSTVEVPVGTYTMSETNPAPAEKGSYSPVLVTGDDGCPKMLENSDNNLDEFTLKKGEHITCIIYNDDNFVEGQAGPAPTVTLKVKVIDADLGVSETSPPSFQVNGQPALLNVQIPVVANESTEITQTNDNVPDDDDENNEVLPSKITGDGHCPEVLAGTITLSSGQDIECVFEYGAEIEPGVIFHYDTQMVGRDETQYPNVGIPCGEVVPAVIGGVEGIRYENTVTQGPCIAINGANMWVVPDLSVTLTDTTIVLFTVIITGSDVDTQLEPEATTCVFNGLAPTLDQIDDDNPTIEPTPLAFRLYCNDLPDEGNWNVNYALIETDPLA